MRFSTISVPASLLCLATLILADAASDVLTLTSADFEQSVAKEPLMLVEFFAPWCGHCKALAPHYEEAATALKEKKIKLAKVDCVEEADLCQSKGVQGYPTLKVYRNGEASEYGGPRKADGIISYMVKQSLPAVSEVNSDNFDQFIKSDRLVVVAYLSSAEDAPITEFKTVAESHRDDYLFGLSTDADVIKKAGVTPPAVIVHRSFDEPQTVYPLPVTAVTTEELAAWIKELAIPILNEVNADNYMMYATSGKPLAYLFLDSASEDNEKYIETLKPVAKKYKSKMNFVHIDAIQFGDHAKALNIIEPKWPAFVIQDLEKQLKYPFDQSKELTTEATSEWVSSYLEGKISPELKSQPVPESQDESVYVVVGKNFEEVVLDKSKDVFVEFYASWCGHCKRLKPTWDTLGEKYAAVKDKLVIAKMEAQENDLPPSAPFRVSGFPTLKFKPAGSDEFIDYEGDRTLESLVEFVETHAKNSLVAPDPDAQVPLSANSSAEVGHDEL